MTNKPLVSVLCLTYNQSRYITQCIEGILMQETDFKFELLINDDASDDGTVDIINVYKKRYPDIIITVMHKKNQYLEGKRNFMIRYLLPLAQGRYIAICEGDDYWTDPFKLQKQVGFMEKHPDYSICFHKVRVLYENGEKVDQVYPDVEDHGWYTHKQLFDINYIQTNSVMYKKGEYDKLPVNSVPGDWFLHLYHASCGKIKLIDEVMSVYRKHPGGMWWDYDRDRETIWRKHGVSHLAMWVNLYGVYANKPIFLAIIKRHIIDMINTIIRLDVKYGDHNFKSALETFPKEVYASLQRREVDLISKQDAVNQLKNELESKEAEIAALAKALNDKEQELIDIRSTRTWRLRQSLIRTKKNFTIRNNRSA